MPFVLHRVVGSRTMLESIDERTLRIGRGTGCDLRLEDNAVALEHARITQDGRDERGSYQLTDLGSVTGTYVGGEPVTSARLRDGDEIAIGDFRLRVRHSDPEDPLFLHVRAAESDPRPDALPVTVETVDYGGRYRLRRRLVTKGMLALAVVAAGIAVVAAIPAARRMEAFRPGDLTSFHSDGGGAASCAQCHAPWQGVTDARCETCHGGGRADEAPPHHPAAAAPATALACTACHREHLGPGALMPAGDASCRSCHGDLRLAPGVEPTFAARVPSFAEHPELRLALPVLPAGDGVRRVPVTDLEARRSDPTRVRLNHAKHLAGPLQSPGAPADPERGTRAGLETLTCESCHHPMDSMGPMGTGFREISFRADCSRCHALTFDARYPDRKAAHGPPEEMARDLALFYQEAGRGTRSTRDEIAGFLGPGREGRSARERGAREEALRAERLLYRSACTVCHALDPEAVPRPRVEEPAIPARWLPHARFSHRAHLRLEGLACVACHAGAPESTESADVLLPTIASCTPCHAAGARSGRSGGTAEVGFPVTPGPSSCRTCHDYHEAAESAGVAP